MNVAIERRARQLDIPEDDAADPRYGYFLGVLLLKGRITNTQHQAGILYGEDMSRFYGLTGVPFPSARAQDLFAVHGQSGEDESRIERARKARATADKLQAILLGVGNIDNGRRVESTVKNVCLLDLEEARNWPAHMLGYLKQGLNVLARKHYGLEG